MTRHPHPDPSPELHRLRELGFTLWDPIGIMSILPPGVTWDRQPTTDEYDRYLVRLVDMIRDGSPDEACVEYLVDIETRHMRMADEPDAALLKRASGTVSAIRRHVHGMDGKDSP